MSGLADSDIHYTSSGVETHRSKKGVDQLHIVVPGRSLSSQDSKLCSLNTKYNCTIYVKHS